MKQKLENFFYYYKYHVCAVVFVITVIIFLIVSGRKVKEPKLIWVDETSAIDMGIAGELIDDFMKTEGWEEGDMVLRYRSSYLDQEKYKDISFEVAGVEQYDELLENGGISLILTHVKAQVDEEKLVSFEEYFTSEELEKYEPYFYQSDGKKVGLIFDKSPKAEEYFGDNYPTEYHYILQIPEGAAGNAGVKDFIHYLFD